MKKPELAALIAAVKSRGKVCKKLRKLRRRLRLIRDVHEYAVLVADDFEQLAGDMADLYAAIANDGGSYCEFDADSESAKLLATGFSPDHKVWKYIKIVEPDYQAPPPETSETQ